MYLKPLILLLTPLGLVSFTYLLVSIFGPPIAGVITFALIAGVILILTFEVL